jgi:SAM-dependent methyltransferase
VECRCPVCDAGTRRIFCVRTEFGIRECARCRHRFTDWRPPADHVSRVYADSYFFGGGAGYPDYPSEGVILREHARKYARRITPYVNPGRLLDVGAACGFLADGFRAAGWHADGIEPNETMAAYGRDRLNLCLHTGTLEDFTSPNRYDVISMIQVLAHFADPRHALEQAAKLTRDRGFWLIETWDSQSLTARAFGKHWHEYNPPSVLHYFSRRSLEHLAHQLGFERVAGGHPGKRIAWGHARSLVDHQLGVPWIGRLTRLVPDDVVLPYPSEDLVWMLFRKQ